ncbi:MAG: hypothetical protein ACRCYW_09110 [Aeromonas sp.]|uniref:hypothetical protein n=1 Tax=Aeromonas sp. TaxID=647 RepID=UPI003F407988
MEAKPQETTFYGVPTAQAWTHVHLLNGRKGREVSRSDGEVVIQCEKGWAQSYDEDRLHLIWAPLKQEQQGEQA